MVPTPLLSFGAPGTIVDTTLRIAILSFVPTCSLVGTTFFVGEVPFSIAWVTSSGGSVSDINSFLSPLSRTLMTPPNQSRFLRVPRQLENEGIAVCPVFPVTDIDASIRHYHALGFETQRHPDGSYAYLHYGRTEIHLLRVPDLDPSTSTSACYLYVPDVDDLYRQWEESDALGYLVPPADTDHGLREFSHVDIDGNLIRVASLLA